jgi:peptide chain release factor subunit 1
MDQIELDRERTLVDEFLREVMQSVPKATYGEAMVRSALKQGAVATLLLSESLSKKRVVWQCKICKHEWERTQNSLSKTPDCPECNSDNVHEDSDRTMELIDELSILAGHTSAEVRLISLDTEEGDTLNTAFGGIAALLRYPIA